MIMDLKYYNTNQLPSLANTRTNYKHIYIFLKQNRRRKLWGTMTIKKISHHYAAKSPNSDRTIGEPTNAQVNDSLRYTKKALCRESLIWRSGERRLNLFFSPLGRDVHLSYAESWWFIGPIKTRDAEMKIESHNARSPRNKDLITF